MKGWLKIALLIIIIFIAVGSFYYLVLSNFFKGAPPITRNSYLLLDIYGTLPERETGDIFTQIITEDVPTLEGLLHCIRKAKVDPKIVGLIIRPLGSSMGWAKTEELKQVLRDFKTANKPIYVYLEIGADKDYYLALEGDMLFGSPTGALLINGLLGAGYFIKGALDKIGIEADFVAHGKYKDAPDMFTRKEMSPATREVLQALLDDFYMRYVDDISQRRNLDIEQVKALIDKGLYTLAESKNVGLIDTLMYFNEFKDYLKEKDNKKPRFVSYSRYKKVPFNKLGIKAKENFALIYCVGSIVSGIGNDFSQDGLIISQGMANTIRSAAKNKKIKAIILRIDSPGGSGIASNIIWREVIEARKEKPVIATMSDVAASGGYYIAMSADSIVAQPSSIVGSIGVYAGKFSWGKLYNKFGISKDEIPKGKNADIFSETQIFKVNQRNLLKKTIAMYYDDFVTKAAEGRNLSYHELDQVAQGRVWTGTQSLENGLIDKLGGLHDAVQIAKNMVGIPKESHVILRTYPKQRSFFERVFSGRLQSKIISILNNVTGYSRNYLKGFFHYRDFEPLFLMPFYLEIN